MSARAATISGEALTYRVPSMAEVDALRGTNNYTAVSTFSGAGGSSLGMSMAGFRVLRAHEFIDAAADTYTANNPNTPVDRRDIRNVTADDLLAKIGLAPGELDLLEGSPPCASFSTAGKRHEGWGKVKSYSDGAQRSDDLFFEFARLVDGVRPRTFTAENVSGLVKGTAKGYFLEILAALKAAGPGYRVEAKLLNAKWLGVPQSRQRVIFIGVRADLADVQGRPVIPAHPEPFGPLITLAEALDGLDAPVEPESKLSPSVEREWRLTRRGCASARYFSLQRLSWDRPSYTATAHVAESAASIAHPDEPRKFSTAELRRICSFPDDFILTGTYAQQGERLGRSVPPLMAREIAATVRDDILDKVAA